MLAAPPGPRVSNARRIFIGGIPIKMDESVLKDYFARCGPVSYFKMAKSKKNKEPLGFGFLEFKDDAAALAVLAAKHCIGGREIDVKPFKKGTEINKQDEDLKKRKLFVKGLPATCTNAKLQTAFEQFGPIDKAFILFDHSNGASRGFGFVEFLSEETVSKALTIPVTIDGKIVKCSPVILKQESITLTVDCKNTKSLATALQTENIPSFNNIKKDSRHKKTNQLKTITLKDDCCGEDEATKESSGNNSFDKFSKENLGSPLVYPGYSNQEFTCSPHDLKHSQSPLSFFQLPLQPQYFLADPFQPTSHFHFRGTAHSQDYSAKPRPAPVLVTAEDLASFASRSQPHAAAPKKPSYYKMF